MCKHWRLSVVSINLVSIRAPCAIVITIPGCVHDNGNLHGVRADVMVNRLCVIPSIRSLNWFKNSVTLFCEGLLNVSDETGFTNLRTNQFGD